MKDHRQLHILGMLQGIYFFVTGIWPLLHLESFIWISGPKYDIWLVKTVGLLLAVIGMSIGAAAYHKRLQPETAFLAIGCAAALAVVDIYYAAIIDRIYAIYLLDAVAEILLVLFWLYFLAKQRKQAGRSS